jgi:hypothetical protein
MSILLFSSVFSLIIPTFFSILSIKWRFFSYLPYLEFLLNKFLVDFSKPSFQKVWNSIIFHTFWKNIVSVVSNKNFALERVTLKNKNSFSEKSYTITIKLLNIRVFRMGNFWNNVLRYPRFFISSVAGLIIIILTPFKNLFKIRKLRIFVVVFFVLVFGVIYSVIVNMTAL